MIPQSIKQLSLIGLFTAASIGCKTNEGIFGVDKCATIPCGAIPAKPGSHVCQWQQAQVASAATDLGVFYQADFVGKTDQLGPAGAEHIARMTQQGLVAKVPVILEPSDDVSRDAMRTISLAAAFTNAGVPMMAEQIQVAYPPAIGLDGLRAQQVARTASRIGGGQGNGQGGGQGGGGQGGSGQGGGFGGGGLF